MPRFTVQILSALLLTSFSLTASERPHNAKAIQPGVTLTLVGEHPNLATPTGIDVDAKGNLWIISCHTHFPPKDYQGPKHDEILVFSKAGKRSVFYLPRGT